MKRKIKNKLKEWPDIGLECEHFFRGEMPYLLNLSNSKIVAMGGKFYQFATYARHLHNKAPAEFERFFSEIKKRIQAVSKYRIPKNVTIGPEMNRSPHTTIKYFGKRTKVVLEEKIK